MAGYCMIGNGRYDGVHKAAVALKNGMFAQLNGEGGVIATSAAKDTKMQVEAKTTLWGMPALEVRVLSVGEDEVFFVANEWDVDDNTGYDEADYTVKIGDFVKMKRPEIGDKFIFTVENSLYSTLTALDTVQPAADGTIAKVGA